MRFGLGVVEGFYGAPWPPERRLAALRILAGAGYVSYLYAPKADRCLRADWRLRPDPQWVAALGSIADTCAAEGMEFGVGLSPLGAGADPAAARADLAVRGRQLVAQGVGTLALLFDDVTPGEACTARHQVDLMRALADASGARQLLFCPTWYSDDPVLEQYSGACPEDYLETLGEALDNDVGVFWTGPEVCTREWTDGHLDDICARLGRDPVLWDNYPVNDGPRMCGQLHLGAFSGRGAAVTERSAGMFANPMNQCALSCAPLLTLPWNLWLPDYDPATATETAFRQCFPPPLADLLTRDWQRFASPGLTGFDERQRLALVADYAAIDHPAADEVVDWLGGKTLVGPEVFAS